MPDTGGPLRLASQPLELNQQVPGSVRDPISKQLGWRAEGETPGAGLWPAHSHAHTCMHTHLYWLAVSLDWLPSRTLGSDCLQVSLAWGLLVHIAMPSFLQRQWESQLRFSHLWSSTLPTGLLL